MRYFNFAPDEAQGKDAQWPRFPLFFFFFCTVFWARFSPVRSKAGLTMEGVKDSPSRALRIPVFTSYNAK